MHIGHLIRSVFDKQTKDHNINWFAAQLHCQRANIYKIFNRDNIDTSLLMKISKILDYDFFFELSKEFQEEKRYRASQEELKN